MLNVIADIGRVISRGEQSNLLKFLIPESVPQKYIVGIDFKLDERRVIFDLLAEGGEGGLSQGKLMEYLFVPTEKGNRPQFSPTSNNLNYLVSQTLPNLRDFLPEDSDLRKRLANVCKGFFKTVQEADGNKKILLLDDKLIDNPEVMFEQSIEKLKDAIADYAKKLANHISEETGVSAKETIYCICFDGKPVAQYREYRHFVVQKNAESAFDGAREGVCAICGRQTQVTQDTTRFTMKFYMTDKVNFASYFDAKNYFKAVALCRVCFQNIIIGEKWIQQHLRTRLGGFDMYLLPQMGWADIEAEAVYRKLSQLANDFNEMKNIEAMRKAETEATEKREGFPAFEQNPFVLNLMFYKKAQSAFKILTLIKDVPPSRIVAMKQTINQVDATREALQMNESLSFDLDRLYWLIPLRKRGADLQEYKKILQLYYCIFNDLPAQKSQLYNFYTKLACMHHFESYGLYQISQANNPDYSIMADTLRWNLFLQFLKLLNLIEGEKPMETNEHDAYYPDGVKDALTMLGYTEAQQGLALLGYVIGVVAYAQYKEGLENRPVLEKINYQGMSEEKVVRLFNDAFEKIRQYRKNKTVSFSERWWALGKKLYESGSNHQRLTADERVFYLLSGYSMNLLRPKPQADEAGDEVVNH